MSFKHTAPIKAKNLCDILTILETIIQGESYEASKSLISQVKAQAEEIKKDIDEETTAQLNFDAAEAERLRTKGQQNVQGSSEDQSLPPSEPGVIGQAPEPTPAVPTEDVPPVV